MISNNGAAHDRLDDMANAATTEKQNVALLAVYVATGGGVEGAGAKTEVVQVFVDTFSREELEAMACKIMRATAVRGRSTP